MQKQLKYNLCETTCLCKVYLRHRNAKHYQKVRMTKFGTTTHLGKTGSMFCYGRTWSRQNMIPQQQEAEQQHAQSFGTPNIHQHGMK